MSITNYDASKVGVPYTRASRILISYPDNNALPTAVIEQALVVLLADGSVRKIQDQPSLTITLDLKNQGTTPIPLVNPADGASLGANTDLNTVMVQILAVLRANQILLNP